MNLRTRLVFRRALYRIIAASGLIATATLIGMAIEAFVQPVNLVMLYLLVVVMAAIRLGYGASIFTAVASVFVFNFFFVPPQYTLHVADAQYLLTFSGFFVVGMVIANLTYRIQQQRQAAEHREQDTLRLYQLSRDLATARELPEIFENVIANYCQTFHAECSITQIHNHQAGRIFSSDQFQMDPAVQTLITHILANQTRTIHQRWIGVPLNTAQGLAGILILQRKPAAEPFSEPMQYLFTAMTQQTCIALEAALLAEKAQQAQLISEREKLQQALLNSISHELRTPMVSITGTLSALRDDSVHMDDGARQELLDGAWLEAERMNRLVQNLLEMSRLQAGTVRLKRELQDIHDVIAVARSQLGERVQQRDIQTSIAPDLPLIPVDLTLMALVISNLLDNAIKYTEIDQKIAITIGLDANYMRIVISDEGRGIAPDDLPHIFERFYRSQGVGNIYGTGLGLSICEGIVEAHQGRIQAQNRPEGGACFIILLPLAETGKA
jgi:two-component system sensor histidine kinase KdpD